MQRIPVESSDIVSIGYQPADKLLEVEFQGGRVYQYRGVEPDIHLQFMRAESYGTFFFAHVNGKYRYQKVSTSVTKEVEGPLTLVNGTAADVQALEVACEQYAIDFETLDIPIDDIQSEDPEDIALKKAKQACKASNRPVVVSATVWNILALHGFPGAYMPQVSGWLTSDDFLRLMDSKNERAVSVTQIVAYTDGQRTKTFRQESRGIITKEAQGEGTSIERIVKINGQDKTLAERHQAGLTTWAETEDSVWNEFAKWLHMRRRFDQS